jgi:hypothetical protein
MGQKRKKHGNEELPATKKVALHLQLIFLYRNNYCVIFLSACQQFEQIDLYCVSTDSHWSAITGKICCYMYFSSVSMTDGLVIMRFQPLLYFCKRSVVTADDIQLST